MGAASLSKVNITSDYLKVTNSTKSPVTVSSAIKTINASSRTKTVKITGNSLANTIKGGSNKDTIYGGKGNDSILGNAGNDKLFGGAGNNTLTGGTGDDTLKGGEGADVFAYFNGDGNDTILDYQPGKDTIKLNSGFILDVSYKKKDLVFTVGSGTITVKNGKGKKNYRNRRTRQNYK